MAEATEVSLNSVLPDELLIKILSKVDSSNPLELRCVCKLWNSLVVQPVVMRNYLFRSLIYFNDLTSKAREHFIACYEQMRNNPAAPQEEEEEHDDNENDDDNNNEEVEEEDKGNQLIKNLLAQRDNLDEEEVKQWAINNAAMFISVFKAEGYIKSFRPVVMFLEEEIRISNGNVEAMRVDMESMEDRVQCLESFMRIYLKCDLSQVGR